MNIDKKKIISFLEYVLLFFVFLIGMKKGGYYKADSVVSIFLIEIISLVIFILNIRDIKKNSIMSLVLLIFSLTYFLPIFINSATVSGALNIWTRIYAMYLLFMIVQNSEKKEKYIKGLVLFTIIFDLLGINELCGKTFEPLLEYLGSGYVEESQSGMASVLQYANILGILNTISAVYIVDKLLKKSSKADSNNEKRILNKIKNICIYPILGFVDIAVFLTESKMCILLFIVSQVALIIMHKRYKELLFLLARLMYAFVIYSIVVTFSTLYVFASLALWIIFAILNEVEVVKEKRKYEYLAIIAMSLIIGIIGISGLLNNGLMAKISEYFTSFSSTTSRIIYWLDGFKIAVMSPLNFLIGAGGNAFRTMYEVVQTQEYISLEVHGFFIQVFFESGILGLLAIIATFCYAIFKGEKNLQNNVYKLMLIVLIIFATFDVFNTYTFMMLVTAILLGLIEFDKKEICKKELIAQAIYFAVVFIFSGLFFIGYAVEPIIVANDTNTIEEQAKVIKYCEFASKVDPWDYMYRRNTTAAYETYLYILSEDTEHNGNLHIDEEKEIIKKMYENVLAEDKYERENKYIVYDVLEITNGYLDRLVQIYYPENVHTGYEEFLEKTTTNLDRLKNNHKYNDLSSVLYEDALYKTIDKYEDINRLLRSEKISLMLKSLYEN